MREPGAPNLLATARRTGRLRGWALEAYTVLGTWAADEPDDEARVLLAVLSHHQAEYAEMLGRRLPQLREVDPTALSTIDDRDAPWFVRFGSVSGTTARLAATARGLLPLETVTLHRLLAECSDVADAPLARSVRALLHGLSEDRDRADGLLLQRLAGQEGVDQAAETVRELDSRIPAHPNGSDIPHTV